MRAVNILNQHELNNGRTPKNETVEGIPGKEIKNRLMKNSKTELNESGSFF